MRVGSSWKRSAVQVGCVATLMLAALSARADDPSDAKLHFRKGAELYKEARYTEAIAEFETAYRLRPAGVLRFNVAQCYEKLGDIPNAIRGYRDYLVEVPNADDRSTVEAALGNLERRLTQRGHQALLVYSTPSAAAVVVDGSALGTSPISVELAPGNHQVQVALLGYRPVTEAITLTSDRLLELNVELHPGTAPEIIAETGSPAHVDLQAPPPPASASPDLQPKVGTSLEPAPSHPRLWTWVAAGAAGVALAAAIIEGVNANSNANHLQTSAVGDPNRSSYYHQAQSSALTANFLYGGAGAAAAGSVVLFFVEGSF